MLSDDLREGQEKLRISTSQTSKLMNEFNEVKLRIEQLARENEVLKAERQRVLQEMSGMHEKLTENDSSYGQKIRQLSSENKMLSDDVREGQEKLRISTSQTSKLMNEFNEVKARIDQLTRENEVLKAERQKVLQELHGFHAQFSENDRAYGDKINKLSSENKMLSDDVREGQEKLRISTSQTSKIMNEFNEVKLRIEQITIENEQYKRRLQDAGELSRRVADYEHKISALSQEIERLNVTLEGRTQENMVLSQEREKLAVVIETRTREIRTYQERLGETEELNRTVHGMNDKLSRLTT